MRKALKVVVALEAVCFIVPALSKVQALLTSTAVMAESRQVEVEAVV